MKHPYTAFLTIYILLGLASTNALLLRFKKNKLEKARNLCSIRSTISNDEISENSILPLRSTPPLKILLLVEPTPFTYISGYANRFKEMLKYLHKAGDEVRIITPDDSPNPPKEYLGFPIISLKGWRLAFYKDVCLSVDVFAQTNKVIEEFKPDIIHATTPGNLFYRAIQ
jgi:hypothetical protein